MLTGDSRAVGEAVANEIGIDEVHTELLPQDKVTKLEEVLASKQKRKSHLRGRRHQRCAGAGPFRYRNGDGQFGIRCRHRSCGHRHHGRSAFQDFDRNYRGGGNTQNRLAEHHFAMTVKGLFLILGVRCRHR